MIYEALIPSQIKGWIVLRSFNQTNYHGKMSFDYLEDYMDLENGGSYEAYVGNDFEWKHLAKVFASYEKAAEVANILQGKTRTLFEKITFLVAPVYNLS